MQENKEEQETKKDEIIPFHYEAEIVKVVAELKGHRFIQRGPYLHCQSCAIQHGIYIGNRMMMTGYNEDGSPRLVARR